MSRSVAPLFRQSLLGAGIRGLRPEPRRLDQEAYRQTHRHRRQRRAVRRRHWLIARRIFQGHRDRRPARPAGARRVRSGRGRSRAAGGPGLAAQGAGGPLRRAAALRARGARDTVLTPRAPTAHWACIHPKCVRGPSLRGKVREERTSESCWMRSVEIGRRTAKYAGPCRRPDVLDRTPTILALRPHAPA